MLGARVAVSTACVACLLAGPATGDPTWGNRTRLTPDDGGPASWDAHVGVGARDQAVAVWTRGGVLQAAARDAGGQWGPPRDLSAGLYPEIAVAGDGHAVVAFMKELGPNAIVQVVERDEAGAWGTPVTLSSSSGGGEPSVAQNASGAAVVAWTRFAHTHYVVEASYRPAGGSWEPGSDVSVPGVNSPRGADVALAPSGDAAVIWARAGPESVAQVVQVAFRSRAGPWLAPVDVGGPAVDVDDPEIAFDTAGNAVAAWIAVRRSADGLRWTVEAAYRPAGGAWGEPVHVSPPGGGVQFLDLVAAEPGVAFAVWRRFEGGAIVSAARASATGAWRLQELGASADYPDLDVDAAGNAVAVWLATGSASRDVLAAVRPREAERWLAHATVARFGGPPQVAVGPSGTAAAVWARLGEAAPTRELVEVVELSPGGPLLVSSSIPRQATAGVPVRFSARHAPWGAPLAGAPTWKFGDGGSATGSSVRHTYTRSGAFTVTVAQTDAGGLAATSTRTIRVAVGVLVNLAPPMIRGRPRVGAVLACSPGKWRSNAPVRFAYRWLRDGRALPGERTRRYRVRERDAGSLLACRVQARSVAGSRTAISRPVAVRT